MKCQGKQEVHNLHLFHLLHRQREVEHRDTKVQLMLLKQRWERMRWKQLLVLRLRSLTVGRERSEQSERAQEKSPPFFCCYLPLNQCPERSSWALLPAHSDRKAARREISHQLLRKPQELGEKTGPGESSAANEAESTQTKNEWEFLFPSLLISVFMESSTTTGPFPLGGGVIYQNKQPPDRFWSGRVELFCLWNSHPGLGTAAAPWEAHWDLLGEISSFFAPEELNSNLPQPTTELGRRDHILMSH